MALQPPQGTSAFFAAHPVFSRAEFASVLDRKRTAATVSSLLRYHLRAGNIKRVAQEVFAAVPAHVEADRWVVDRFAAASKLRADGVLGFHSALELHGVAYSEFNEVQILSAGRPGRVDLPIGPCRFITPQKALKAAGKTDYQTVSLDRQGVNVRVTAIERTVVDVLHRFELSGGAEEVVQSLGLVRYLNVPKVIDYVKLLDSRSIASTVGWWLDSKRTALGVADADLARLRRLLPRSKHYALGAKPGDAVLVDKWRVLLSPRFVNATI